MQVILDSNVILSAFIARTGICSYLYELCLLKHAVLLSHDILAEVADKLRHKFKLKPEDIRQIIFHLKMYGKVFSVTVDEGIAVRDKKDRHLLALAGHTQADVLVTGDKDLLVLKKYKGTAILTPKEFWLKYS